jgi:phosphoglycerol transferase MdoB-like AlkP superfamily enzyme
MNFDSYSRIAGYEDYYGKNEYNNDKDFDGFWGIFDEPFLQSCVVKMNKMKQPFHTSIFTISSHHPYVIPKQHQNKFKKGTYENHESIGYGDYSLRQFFNAAKKTSWFSNTLFIITADHASISGDRFYKTIVGNMAIPILFYRGDNSLTLLQNQVFSQMDILPTAMELLGYDAPFFSFGTSYSDTLGRYAYFASNGNYHVVNDSNYYVVQPPALLSKYNYKTDIDLVNPINKTNKKDSLALNRFNALIQSYNATLLKNSIP